MAPLGFSYMLYQAAFSKRAQPDEITTSREAMSRAGPFGSAFFIKASR